VSDYGLDDRAIGVRSPAEAKDFSSSLCVQTGSESELKQVFYATAFIEEICILLSSIFSY
jgi:hypothetical protein